jgi:hypothetical protein
MPRHKNVAIRLGRASRSIFRILVDFKSIDRNFPDGSISRKRIERVQCLCQDCAKAHRRLFRKRRHARHPSATAIQQFVLASDEALAFVPDLHRLQTFVVTKDQFWYHTTMLDEAELRAQVISFRQEMLWLVDDQATALLTEKLYANLALKARWLRAVTQFRRSRTQSVLANGLLGASQPSAGTPNTRHPYHWAVLIFYGVP